MAIAMLMEFPGGSISQYDQLVARLNLKNRLYKGGLFHVAGPTDEGMRIVDVWESQAAFDAFFQDKLQPAMEAAGIEPPQVKSWEVHSAVSPSGQLANVRTPTTR